MSAWTSTAPDCCATPCWEKGRAGDRDRKGGNSVLKKFARRELVPCRIGREGGWACCKGRLGELEHATGEVEKERVGQCRESGTKEQGDRTMGSQLVW